MKVNVSGILRSVNSSMKIDDVLNISSINYKMEDIPVNSPIEVKAVITNMGDHLHLEGSIKANVKLRCSRCLESFDYVLNTEFEEELSNMETDDDYIYFQGDSIDLTDIITNNIVLSLPMKFVCSESCKGLCPHCGCNKNISECSCSEEDMDPRFLALKKLLKDN